MIFSPGEEEATIQVSTLNDTVVEDRETFIIVLSTNDLDTEVDSAVTVNIIDNDGIEIFGIYHKRLVSLIISLQC